MSPEQQQRMTIEHGLLFRYFGQHYWFEYGGFLCAEIGLRTNGGTQYAVRFVLPESYPDDCPSALVTHPVPLVNRRGRSLATIGASASMHVLDGEGPYTSICHYHPARWGADRTLYEVAIKSRLWLEAYEIHLRTGEPIDTYLAHMKESA